MSADLLLQTGGFSAIVLDMGSLAPEYVARIELSTWHRYRLAAERTQSSILLLATLVDLNGSMSSALTRNCRVRVGRCKSVCPSRLAVRTSSKFRGSFT